jgi:hypothetical protein
MPMPVTLLLADWLELLPGIALWALALYLPLSLPLGRLEESLQAGQLDGATQQLVLILASLSLALIAGVAMELLLCWALGPGWASSLGLMAVLAGVGWSLAARRDAE